MPNTEHPDRICIGELQHQLSVVLPEVELALTPLPLTPEVLLWLVSDLMADRPLPPDVVNQLMTAPPYWSLCWASGQILAQQILQNPAWVEGKTVVDVGAGSGVVAIAAAKAGARRVVACDIDADARLACQVNARANKVSLLVSDDLDRALDGVEVITAADILYDRDNLALLSRFRGTARVLLADSRLPDLNPPGFHRQGEWSAVTWPDVGELQQFNQVRVFDTETPSSSAGLKTGF